ncbi:unnamed protein product [Pedinophyceae sp. YPF-701]|nr:unnamed protein product [Pedinophyceae sp. YPF-701]
MVAPSRTTPAGDWQPCGDSFYTCQHMYDMSWGKDDPITGHFVAMAPNGGCIASVRDETKTVRVDAAGAKSALRTFTGSGKPLGTYPWDGEPACGIGWTPLDTVAVVDASGAVRVYDPLCTEAAKHFTLGLDVMSDGVSLCHVSEVGIAATTPSGLLYAVASFEEPRPARFPLALPAARAGNGADAPGVPTCLATRRDVEGDLEVLLGVGDAILVVDAQSCEPAACATPGIWGLAIAPLSGLVAARCANGDVLVLQPDLQAPVATLKEPAGVPRGAVMTWCGPDALALGGARGGGRWLLGPFGGVLELSFDGPVVLSPEVDGLRVLAPREHSLVSRVPQAQVDVWGIGSTEPGAILNDARAMYDDHDPAADTMVRMLGPKLPRAVECCVRAALADFHQGRQRFLLRAAAYGKALGPVGVAAELMGSSIRRLRVLNAVRASEVGMALTAAQADALTMDRLCRRLVLQHHHLLALRACEFLGRDLSPVATHWAIARITAGDAMSDQELLAAVLPVLSSVPGAHFSRAAVHAAGLGRRRLAATLLEREPVVREQVGLLLSMGEAAQALDRAMQCHEADLALWVLLRTARMSSLDDVLKLLEGRPQAREVFYAHCRQADPALLRQVPLAIGRSQDLAAVLVGDAMHAQAAASTAPKPPCPPPPAGATQSPEELLERAAGLWAGREREDKDAGLLSRACHEAARLHAAQGALERELGRSGQFVGKPVAATIEALLANGNVKQASALRSEFRVSDAAFAAMQVRALAGAGAWPRLESLAGDRRSPHLQPGRVLDLAMGRGMPEDVATRLIGRLTSVADKAQYLTALGKYEAAAHLAAQAKDSELLSRLRGAVGEGRVGAMIDQLRDRLTMR